MHICTIVLGMFGFCYLFSKPFCVKLTRHGTGIKELSLQNINLKFDNIAQYYMVLLLFETIHVTNSYYIVSTNTYLPMQRATIETRSYWHTVLHNSCNSCMQRYESHSRICLRTVEKQLFLFPKRCFSRAFQRKEITSRTAKPGAELVGRGSERKREALHSCWMVSWA